MLWARYRPYSPTIFGTLVWESSKFLHSGIKKVHQIYLQETALSILLTFKLKIKSKVVSNTIVKVVAKDEIETAMLRVSDMNTVD